MAEANPTDSLPLLQDRIKRDPQGYKNDFLDQYLSLQASLDLVKESPVSLERELVMFCAQTASYYGRAQELADRLLAILQSIVKPGEVKILLSAVALMDNRNCLDKAKVYGTLMGYLETAEKDVGSVVVKQLIKGISGTKDQTKVKQWQRSVFGAFRTSKSELFSRRLIFIMMNLYLKQCWNDAATANTIALGLDSPFPAVAESAARFILGDTKRLHITAMGTGADEVDDEAARQTQAALVSQISKELSAGANLKKKRGKKRMERLKEAAEKSLAKIEGKSDSRVTLTFEIMERLFDPHSIAEKAFKRCSKQGQKDSFRLKLLLFTVSARLLGRFGGTIPGFFTFFGRYLKPSQDQITRILAILAQAVHEYSPEEELQACTKLIADQFIVETSASEAITVGLNTVREMCARNLQAVTPELLADLIEYNSDGRHPPVRVAAASLRNLYRQKAPDMLPKKQRGRQDGLRDAEGSGSALEGLDLLMRLKKIHNQRRGKKGKTVDLQGIKDLKDFQTNKILSSRDFAALKKIRVKLSTARSLGQNLIVWLDQTNGWDDLTRDIFGDDESPPSKRRRLVEPVNVDEVGTEIESGSETDPSEVSESQELEEVSGEELTLAASESDDGSEGEADDDSGKESTSTSGGSVATTDSDDEASDDENDGLGIVTGDSLKGRTKVSRRHAKVLARQTKAADRENLKEERRQGSEANRAGITNKVASRNKPMAMLRQKRSVRDKRQRSARDKVDGLRAHVKTLKMQKRQKLRRR